MKERAGSFGISIFTRQPGHFGVTTAITAPVSSRKIVRRMSFEIFMSWFCCAKKDPADARGGRGGARAGAMMWASPRGKGNQDLL